MMMADLLVKSLANIADIVGLANLVLSPSHIIFRPGIEKGRKKGRERAVLSFLTLSPNSLPPMLHTTSQHSFPSLQLERLQCSYAQKDVKKKRKKNRKELKLNPKIYRQLHVVYSAQCSDV
jgi:hypothetical protein